MSRAGPGVIPAAVVALGLILVACDEDGPSGHGTVDEGRAGAGGLGGVAGTDGGAGGGGGVPSGGSGGEPDWPASVEVLAWCDPSTIEPTCAEWFDSYECVEHAGAWYYIRRDCGAEGGSCDWLTSTCLQPSEYTPCDDYCTLGEYRCSTDSSIRMRCAPGPDSDAPPELAHCPWFVAADECPGDQVCHAGACIESCTQTLCDCPVDLAPACAGDGTFYWNACFRACAGQHRGVGCRLAQWDAVWDTPPGAHKVLPVGAGLLLTNLAPNLINETRPNFGTLLELSPGPLGPSTTVTALWRERLGDVDRGESWPLEQGSALVKTQELDTAWSIVDRTGIRARLEFPANDGRSVYSRTSLMLGDRLWIHVPGRLLYADLPGLTQLSVASAHYDFDEEEGKGATRFTFDGVDPRPLLITASSPVSFWRLDPEAGRRQLVGRIKQDFGVHTLSAPHGVDGNVPLTLQGTRIDPAGVHLRLTDGTWDGACFQRRSMYSVSTPGLGHMGQAGYGDLDGDGDEDVAWATGDEVLVLLRRNGFLTLAGRIPLTEPPFDGENFTDAFIWDVDGDGRPEIWVFDALEGWEEDKIYGRVWRRRE